VLAAGQLIGTESYTAASAGGWLAGTNAARLALARAVDATGNYNEGSLFEFIVLLRPTFPTNAAEFGILPELESELLKQAATI